MYGAVLTVLKIAFVLCEIGMLIVGGRIVYDTYSEPIEEDVVDEHDDEEFKPGLMFYLASAFFWPSNRLFESSFGERYFHSKYSIIIAIPLYFMVPLFFWACVIAAFLGGLMTAGILH